MPLYRTFLKLRLAFYIFRLFFEARTSRKNIQVLKNHTDITKKIGFIAYPKIFKALNIFKAFAYYSID